MEVHGVYSCRIRASLDQQAKGRQGHAELRGLQTVNSFGAWLVLRFSH